MSSDTVDVRGTIRHAINSPLAQRFLTALNGKPLPGQKPLLGLRELPDALIQPILIAAGIVISLACLASGSPALCSTILPMSMLYTSGRLRYLQVIVNHNAIHGQVFQGRAPWKRKLNDHLANLLSGFACIASAQDYKGEHLSHHSPNTFSMKHDGDAKFIYQLGFTPGKTVEQNVLHLLKTLVDPAFHWKFLHARFTSMWRGGWLNRSAFGLSALAVTVLSVIFGPGAVMLSVVLPATVLYNMSALLQFLSEHQWHPEMAPRRLDKSEVAARCHARFCGEAYPVTGTHTEKFVWWVRLFLIYLPIRMWVLVGDLVAHDFHHLGAGRIPSTHLMYERENSIQSGDSYDLRAREYWGLSNALRGVFESLAAQESIALKNEQDDLSTDLALA